MSLPARLAAAVVASVLDICDEVMAEVARLRGGDSEPATSQHRYDPASTTECTAERAEPGAPYSARAPVGDIAEDSARNFGFGAAKP